jgi:heme/copper-type cytochrome/quinol oxidase subunit 2
MQSNSSNNVPVLKSAVKRWAWVLPWAAVGLLILFLPFPQLKTTPTERHFQIEAESFQFSPAVLHVNPGDRVTIELTSTDVVHGLSIDNYEVMMAADPGKTVKAIFIADKTGTFRFRCSIACGNLHPFMIGKLQVGANMLFIRSVLLSILAVLAGVWKILQSQRAQSVAFIVNRGNLQP